MTDPAGKLIDTGTVCVPPEQTAASGPSVIDRGVAAPDEAQPAVCSLQFEVQVSVPPPRPRLSHVRRPRSVRSQSSSGRLMTPSPQKGTPTQPDASSVQSGWQASVPPRKPTSTQVLPPRSAPSHASPGRLITPSPQRGGAAQPVVSNVHELLHASVPGPSPRPTQLSPPRSAPSQASEGRLMTPSPQRGGPVQPVVSRVHEAVQASVPVPRPRLPQVAPRRSVPSHVSAGRFAAPSPQNGTRERANRACRTRPVMNGSLSQLPSPCCCPSRKPRMSAISEESAGTAARARLAAAVLSSSEGPAGPKLPEGFRRAFRKFAPALIWGSRKNRAR